MLITLNTITFLELRLFLQMIINIIHINQDCKVVLEFLKGRHGGKWGYIKVHLYLLVPRQKNMCHVF